MSSYVDTNRLAAMMKARRGNRGLRDTAKEIGDVSPSTLSRIENGKTPDMDTFLLVCDWLEISPNELIENTKNEQPPQISTPDAIALHLRADANLDPSEARLLEKMFKAAYEQTLAERKPEDR